MIKVTVIAVGKIKEKGLLTELDEYKKRLKAFCDFEVVEIKPAPLPENPNEAQISSALASEEKTILDKVPKGFSVYPLCIEGKSLSSEQLAEKFENGLSEGKSICFIIGGSHGLSDKVKALGEGISFSKMTFPHRLFRLMLFEQIYRAFTITAGKKYHK